MEPWPAVPGYNQVQVYYREWMLTCTNNHFGKEEHNYSHWLGLQLEGGTFSLPHLMMRYDDAASHSYHRCTLASLG